MSIAYRPHIITTRLGDAVRRAWQINPPLVLFALASLTTLFVAAVGMIVDPRAATAAPGWVKPLKFAISLFIYSATVLWLLTYVHGFRRSVAVVATLTALVGALELAIITLQVVRGTYSHFNAITPFDNTLFLIMGGAIVVLWLMSLGLGVLLLIQRIPNPVLAWGCDWAYLLPLLACRLDT